MQKPMSKSVSHTAKVLVATYLELMGVSYRAEAGHLVVQGQILDCSDAQALCSYDPEEARAALENVLAPVTVTPIPALPRKPPPPGPRSYRQDLDLVVWREHQLRRTPNPPPWVFSRFEGLCRSAAKRFYQLNRTNCDRLGYEVSDLQTHTQMWLILFWGRHRRLEAEVGENERFFRSFLNQRFAELHGQMQVEPRPRYLCTRCDTEYMELETCCDTQVTPHPRASQPPVGGLRTQMQLASPPDLLSETTMRISVSRHPKAVRGVEMRGGEDWERVSIPTEVRLGTLNWKTIKEHLRGMAAAEQVDLLQDLVVSDHAHIREPAQMALARLEAKDRAREARKALRASARAERAASAPSAPATSGAPSQSC
jgi:hypothetical protein